MGRFIRFLEGRKARKVMAVTKFGFLTTFSDDENVLCKDRVRSLRSHDANGRNVLLLTEKNFFSERGTS